MFFSIDRYVFFFAFIVFAFFIIFISLVLLSSIPAFFVCIHRILNLIFNGFSNMHVANISRIGWQL